MAMKKNVLFLIPFLTLLHTAGCTDPENEDGLATVTTASVTEIGSVSAKSGGEVTDKGGSNVVDRGICWSTSPSPTTGDNSENSAWGTGAFESLMLNLSQNTTYYVRAYAINDAGTAYGDQRQFTTQAGITPIVVGGGVTDMDGNAYASVIIGGKEWMSENLRVSRFNNGNVISHIQPQDEWNVYPNGTPAYCWFRNDPGNDLLFGKLYNGYVVEDPRNCCPSGWHVPSGEEWEALENHLLMNGYNYDGTNIANLLAKSVASTSGWFNSADAGNPGNDPQSNNTSGFNGRPAGGRFLDYFGSHYQFSAEGESASWWGRPFSQYQSLSTAGISYGAPWFSVGDADDNRSARSIRCVKD
jgi:uncharacterized protein (TIGR02145 family)